MPYFNYAVPLFLVLSQRLLQIYVHCTPQLCLSVCLHKHNTMRTAGRIYIKFDDGKCYKLIVFLLSNFNGRT